MITRRSTTWVHFLLRAAALPAAFSLLAGLTPSEAAPRSTCLGILCDHTVLGVFVPQIEILMKKVSGIYNIYRLKLA